MNEFVRTVILLDRKEKQVMKHWVHPINAKRNQYEEYHHLFNDLKNEETRFFYYLTMKIRSFEQLHSLIRENI